jgi:hypothetical protein
MLAYPTARPSARLQHQPAKRQGVTPVFAGDAVSALMSSDALCARITDSPRWPLPRIKSGVACAIMLAFALVLAASVGSANAQEPSATALATAKELITVKGAVAIFDPLVPGVIEQTKSVFLRTNPMLGKDLNEVAAKLRTDYAPRGAEVINDTAKLYATRFTEQELKDALAFYKSPLGGKLLVEEPKLLDEGMKNAQTWANKLSEEIIGKIRAEMKKRGHDI